MKLYTYLDRLNMDKTKVNPSAKFLDGLNGSCSGICFYNSLKYEVPGCHDDQEGFYVIEGSGTVLMGDTEAEVRPDMAILLPPRTKHSFKRNPDSVPIKVFWFHAAI
ncbi:MAG: cupin domain-containing protein [Clostridiaceae bacterium]